MWGAKIESLVRVAKGTNGQWIYKHSRVLLCFAICDFSTPFVQCKVKIEQNTAFGRRKKGHISKKPKSDVPAKKREPNANQNYSLKRRLSEILVYFTAM